MAPRALSSQGKSRSWLPRRSRMKGTGQKLGGRSKRVVREERNKDIGMPGTVTVHFLRISSFWILPGLNIFLKPFKLWVQVLVHICQVYIRDFYPHPLISVPVRPPVKEDSNHCRPYCSGYSGDPGRPGMWHNRRDCCESRHLSSLAWAETGTRTTPIFTLWQDLASVDKKNNNPPASHFSASGNVADTDMLAATERSSEKLPWLAITPIYDRFRVSQASRLWPEKKLHLENFRDKEKYNFLDRKYKALYVSPLSDRNWKSPIPPASHLE